MKTIHQLKKEIEHNKGKTDWLGHEMSSYTEECLLEQTKEICKMIEEVYDSLLIKDIFSPEQLMSMTFLYEDIKGRITGGKGK